MSVGRGLINALDGILEECRDTWPRRRQRLDRFVTGQR